MSQNVMKFSGANWYVVKSFTKILGISETNGIYLDINAKVIDSNLSTFGRNAAATSNGFTFNSDTDYIDYNGKSYHDMMQLYKDFKNNELSKEIDEALG